MRSQMVTKYGSSSKNSRRFDPELFSLLYSSSDCSQSTMSNESEEQLTPRINLPKFDYFTDDLISNHEDHFFQSYV